MKEITFKYKDKILTTLNLEKKLKRMKISLSDIEILPQESKQEEKIEYEDITTYKFINNKTGEVIISIYDNLDNLREIVNVNEYVLLR